MRVLFRPAAEARAPIPWLSHKRDGWPASQSVLTDPTTACQGDVNARAQPRAEAPVAIARGTTTGRPVGGPEVDQETGGVLLSQALAGQVPSALRGLTALFGMGRGVSPSLKPPEKDERPRLPVLQNCTAPHRVSLQNPSSPRPISTGLLQTLPSLQIRPINLVVYQGSYSL